MKFIEKLYDPGPAIDMRKVLDVPTWSAAFAVLLTGGWKGCPATVVRWERDTSALKLVEWRVVCEIIKKRKGAK